MSLQLEVREPQRVRGDLIKHAVELLSQQVWCWGRDILRPDGNWLLEIGFDRMEPPDDREGCSSVYSLAMPNDRCVVLRGFGVFYCDICFGGVFLPRYEFRPKYTTKSTLDLPPWADTDLPEFEEPNESHHKSCMTLARGLIDWIHDYEFNIVDALGIEYRQSMLEDWDNGKRSLVPAEAMAQAWKMLGSACDEDGPSILRPVRSKKC